MRVHVCVCAHVCVCLCACVCSEFPFLVLDHTLFQNMHIFDSWKTWCILLGRKNFPLFFKVLPAGWEIKLT